MSLMQHLAKRPNNALLTDAFPQRSALPAARAKRER